MPNTELVHGAATVVGLAGHFGAMKRRVAELKKSIQAQQRGFFTPTEDEQTRHLLVSYCQSRNALIELVLGFHRTEGFDPKQRPISLAIAYAGALVLVDGAMFLRENFHDRPVVRAKLNEPEPNFGIPKGTYDRVQASLTNPRHAWHLYHAMKFVKENWSVLQASMQHDIGFREVLGIIEQLQDRLKIRTRQFIMARTRERARSMRTRIERDLLGRGLYGLQKCVSRLISEKYLRAGHRPGLPSHIDSELESHLQPGDVIVTRKEHAVTNYFLPGYWPHVALYIGSVADMTAMQLERHANVKPRWEAMQACDDRRDGRVLEALKDGVRIRSLSCPLGSDAIAVVRPQLSSTEIAEAIGRGFFHDGKPYDFDFDFTRSDRMVCTEVVYRSYEGVGGSHFKLTKRAGRMTFSAEDLLHQALVGDGFDVHVVYCPKICATMIRHGDDAVQAIKSTIGPGQN